MTDVAHEAMRRVAQDAVTAMDDAVRRLVALKHALQVLLNMIEQEPDRR